MFLGLIVYSLVQITQPFYYGIFNFLNSIISNRTQKPFLYFPHLKSNYSLEHFLDGLLTYFLVEALIHFLFQNSDVFIILLVKGFLIFKQHLTLFDQIRFSTKDAFNPHESLFQNVFNQNVHSNIGSIISQLIFFVNLVFIMCILLGYLNYILSQIVF